MTMSIEIRRLRLQRLIGLDETKGVRGDLARLRAAAARGHTTGANGKLIGEAIAGYEAALVTYRKMLDGLEIQAVRDKRVDVECSTCGASHVDGVDCFGEPIASKAVR
jgi:hypothetical protein